SRASFANRSVLGWFDADVRARGLRVRIHRAARVELVEIIWATAVIVHRTERDARDFTRDERRTLRRRLEARGLFTRVLAFARGSRRVRAKPTRERSEDERIPREELARGRRFVARDEHLNALEERTRRHRSDERRLTELICVFELVLITRETRETQRA